MANWSWLIAPVLVSVLMAIALVPLGNEVLKRGVVFADLAIAQWASLGALIGGALFSGMDFFSGLVLAVFASGMVAGILHYSPVYREAIIGCLYVVGASLSVLAVSNDPHGAQKLSQSLNGDILWSNFEDLINLGCCAIAVMAWQRVRLTKAARMAFLPLFAVTVTICVLQAGVYVVFATLIITPLLVLHVSKKPLIYAITLCVTGHWAGLVFSGWLDLPAGVLIVLSVCCAGGLFAMFNLVISTRFFGSD